MEPIHFRARFGDILFLCPSRKTDASSSSNNKYAMIDAVKQASAAEERPAQRPRLRNGRSRKSVFPASTICNVTGADAFCENYNRPHVPVSVAFGSEALHACRLHGSWDLALAVEENAASLCRSIRKLPSKNTPGEWDDLTFRFGPRDYLYADKDRVVGFASTPAQAERLVAGFSKKYRKPAAPSGGCFHLIEQDRYDIRCQTVTLPADTILSDEAVELHYGDDGRKWHQDFVTKLRERNSGLSIFEGKPGTGKTYYLRHLTGVLKESHRFYFIPTAMMSVLSKPEFTGFWAEQRRLHEQSRFVVILEDSDSALMTRASDNRDQVSSILNLSDGMLADFLRLQIICTINCSTADIDPALLRPGRLVCHRVFGRLDSRQAARLAESLGRKLGVAGDYSLAEVYAGNAGDGTSRPRIGFAA